MKVEDTACEFTFQTKLEFAVYEFDERKFVRED